MSRTEGILYKDKEGCRACFHNPTRYSRQRWVDRDDTLELAKQAKQKLEKLDVDFKTHHYNLIHVIDDEDSPLREQVIIDKHDDEQAILAIRVQQLITTCDSSSQVGIVHPRSLYADFSD